MKIMYFVTDYNAARWHLRNYCRVFSSNYEIIVVGNNVSRLINSFPNVKFIDLPVERKPSIFFDIIILVKFIKLLKRERPTVLHTLMPKSGFIGAIAGYFARIPMRLHTFTGQVWVHFTGFKKTYYIFIDRIITILNVRVLTDSKSQSNFLFKNGIRYKNKPIPFLGSGSLSGVDLSRFKLNNDKVDLDIAKKINDKFVFTYIARKTLDKGGLDILIAFSKFNSVYNNSVLLYIGPMEDKKIINEFILNYSSNSCIYEFGAVDNHEDYLSCTDVLCLPSKREGFGTIVIEAAAMGCPTIGYQIPGLVDAVENFKTGFLVELNNISDFIKSMELLYLNPELLKALSNNAHNRAISMFDSDLVCADLMSLYKSL